MRYISLFSGIEAATVAWEPLGWEPVCFSEIDQFACAVLAHRFPNVPNYGDITEIKWEEVIANHGAVDLVIGGSPCQSFSTAGSRASLDGESRLMFEYIRAVHDIRPRWLVWENVPGVFSVRDNAFGQLLDELENIGYGLAWRTLDAQFFGVAQRRRRVFLVGHAGGMVGRAAAVLFERDSMRGNTQPSRAKRESLAGAAGIGAGIGSLSWSINRQMETESTAQGKPESFEIAPTLDTSTPHTVVSLQTDHLSQNGTNVSVEVCKTLDTASGVPAVMCMASGSSHAEIGYDIATTQAARQYKDPPIICVPDDKIFKRGN